MRDRWCHVSVWVMLLSGVPCVSGAGQQDIEFYTGVLVGVATLSADARSDISDSGFSVSLYEPQNGPTANLLLGVHVHDYLTFQGNYIWNRNEVMLLSTRTSDTGRTLFQQFGSSSQQMLVADVLVYFRQRNDRIRPYLSGGIGVARFTIETAEIDAAEILATFRVAVGMDVAVGRGWAIRYSFSESLNDNPLSRQLTPPGRRDLANFQNLVGVVKAF